MSTATLEMLAARIDTLETLVKQIADKNPIVEKKATRSQDNTERKKRALSGYQIFCNANRAEVQAYLVEEAGEGVKLARGAALSELGTRSKHLRLLFQR